MKIRTDFVTNSSSYSSAEIVIDNPVMLEILKKYKEKGLEGGYFNIGSYDLNGDIGPFPDEDTAITPAFIFYEEDAISIDHTYIPKHLDEAMDLVIRILGNELWETNNFNADIYTQMINELDQKRNDILNAYNSVKWVLEDSTNEHDEDYEGYITDIHSFKFEQANGEEYNHKKVGESFDKKTQIILDEEHIINGRKIK